MKKVHLLNEFRDQMDDRNYVMTPFLVKGLSMTSVVKLGRPQ
jgi:hypothetical protein